MSKSTALLLLIALLLFASLAEAARHEPADPANAQQQVGESEEIEEGCEQVGEDECLMRRTLEAHTDYIYTQGKGKKH
ncbi:phytosulfokines-like [Zingiber officinale]|uniref:Phytosulfokine n=1 Tax=Zingiber officinale TaxID=94328 RepID=A0A8J5HEI9_ZINOF|nr:phytosulfokines-like [Zingiber officinale]XP_042471532.1 phytosulfokines-like [Zingiber officinale]KAG6517467.1 hypothetical protein ZIOFF_020859 [Zingiber officinale]KAG6520238.1 hypothetical protein ZIOFF_017276 [Zingiber officinale]